MSNEEQNLPMINYRGTQGTTVTVLALTTARKIITLHSVSLSVMEDIEHGGEAEATDFTLT